MYLNIIREKLLNEAKASPDLLSDLAGLESYIAESYHNRSFIELLQNADDAWSTKFKILKDSDLLFVANNGREFNQADLESLCRSASSNKLRWQNIGYRWIGFKSVVSFAKEIHILSWDLELTFSKELTLLEIPNATRTPLIRIPHPLSNEVKNKINSIVNDLKNDWYSTIFVFMETMINEIESEFNFFEYTSLLFLKNITKTELFLKEKVSTEIKKTIISDSENKVIINVNWDITNWFISNKNNSSIAFSISDKNDIIKLPYNESVYHSFLPTEDKSWLWILINWDFSTDPSRRHLILDELTNNAIKSCSLHILELLEKSIQYWKENFFLVESIVPYQDPRMLQFTKNSFERKLLEYIKDLCTDNIKNIKYSPIWLNHQDFNKINWNLNVINFHFYEINGFIAFMKYLWITEACFLDIKDNINKSNLSILWCSQIVQYIFKTLLLSNNILDFLDLKIFYSWNERKSLREINAKSLNLDESFLLLLIENWVTKSDIKQVLKKVFPNTNMEEQFLINDNWKTEIKQDMEISKWFSWLNELTNNQIKYNIKRWRSAEEQTLELLNLNGFVLEDVSKQNIGYDLWGLDPNWKNIQIEVKSITSPWQKFKLTNNEIAIAQEKKNSFCIAIVRQYENVFEIALIRDPVNNLNFNRQCVQWIWECENYEYNPLKFNI